MTYVLGFIVSLILTLTAYFLVVHHTGSFTMLAAAIVALACVQALVQLIFFFHLARRGEGLRERLIILGCTTFVVGILVSGSIWIMFTLNQRMMPSAAQMDQYMESQSGL